MNSKANSTVVYLPVEISRRELISRAFLACRLANDGHEVLVFASDLFDRFGWPAPGVYIGKNVFRSYVPHDLSYMRKMKAAGVDIWYLDEEAGILPGSGPTEWEFHLQRRTDATALDADDLMLVWGDYQKDFFERQGLKAAVVVSGSVNFEVYQPGYAELFEKYDSAETRGAKNYVLFNTRFATANPYFLGSGHVINSSLHTGFVSDPERYDSLSLDGVLLYHFVGLISELALKDPHTSIVVRPHPMENATFYDELFSLLPNVTVTGEGDAGSWIRRSRCLVQNGCTTGIQANIAGKPVITYVPADAGVSHACSPLPNELGTIVTSRQEAIAAIRAPSARQATGRWPIAISTLDTTAILEDLLRQRAKPSRLNDAKLVRIAKKSRADNFARRAAYRAFPGKRAEAAMRDKWFDRTFFERFPELLQIPGGRWPAALSVDRLGPDCWRVRKDNWHLSCS